MGKCFDKESSFALEKIEEYICDELNDSLLYAELAKMARPCNAKILNQMSAEEEMHSKKWLNAYQLIACMKYIPKKACRPKLDPCFYDILKERYAEETEDYHEYTMFSEQFDDDEGLSKLAMNLAADEQRHADWILDMLVT